MLISKLDIGMSYFHDILFNVIIQEECPLYVVK